MPKRSAGLDRRRAGDQPSELDKAVEFFIESLSPFEMSLQGYRENNARLTALNEALDQARIATEAANASLNLQLLGGA